MAALLITRGGGLRVDLRGVVVTYSDIKLLLEYARLLMEIVVYSNTAAIALQQGYTLSPTDRLTVVRTSESKGFRAHRAFVARLAPSTRARYLAQVRRQMEAMRKVFAQAKADGAPMSMDPFDIQIRDLETGEAIGAALTLCQASGGGIPGAYVEAGKLIVQCPSCKARWDAHDISFKLPNHEPMLDKSVDAR